MYSNLKNIIEDFHGNLGVSGKKLINKIFYPLAIYYEANILPENSPINTKMKNKYFELLQKLQISIETNDQAKISLIYEEFKNLLKKLEPFKPKPNV